MVAQPVPLRLVQLGAVELVSPDALALLARWRGPNRQVLGLNFNGWRKPGLLAYLGTVPVSRPLTLWPEISSSPSVTHRSYASILESVPRLKFHPNIPTSGREPL
jgi:hypothetical protein